MLEYYYNMIVPAIGLGTYFATQIIHYSIVKEDLKFLNKLNITTAKRESEIFLMITDNITAKILVPGSRLAYAQYLQKKSL